MGKFWKGQWENQIEAFYDYDDGTRIIVVYNEGDSLYQSINLNQNLIGRRPVGDASPYVFPFDVALGRDDDGGRRRDPVIQQVVNSVVLGDLGVLI